MAPKPIVTLAEAMMFIYRVLARLIHVGISRWSRSPVTPTDEHIEGRRKAFDTRCRSTGHA
jgi:hypothetical protein